MTNRDAATLVANDNPQPICIPDDDVLRRPSSVKRLAMAYKAKGISRRKLLNFMSEHLNHCKVPVFHYGVKVRVDGAVVDDIFDSEGDPSSRWLGSFLNFAVEPPRQQAQRRVLERLTTLWLALAIHNPVQAALIIK